MTSERREVDDDFADYVRARQHQLLRAAYLVCGDHQLAEEAVESALGRLALRWERVRDDNPDLLVRQNLYRIAMSRRRRRGADRMDWLELVPELAGLSPKQRAVVVLAHFEERTEAEVAEVLGMSVGAVRHQSGLVRRDVLQDAAAPIVERDFVDRAGRGARLGRRRTRRIWLAAVAGGAALVAGVSVLPGGAGDVAPPAPTPSTSPSAAPDAWDPREFRVLGARSQVGPAPEQIPGVPRIDDLTRSQLALPELLWFGPATVIPSLSDLGNNGAPVRAVLLRHTGDGLRAVLVRPTLSNPFVLVDTVPLVRNVDEGGNTSEPLEVKAIADDRRHVMFLQPGKVLVLDAYTGDVRTIAVPDTYLEQGGWVGTSIIAWSETLRWRIVPDTGEVRRVAAAAYPGRHQVQAQNPDRLRVLEFDDRGTSTGTLTGPPLLSGVWGATFTNAQTRVATGGFLSMDAALEANQTRPQRLFQGILTMDVEAMRGARLLIAPGSEGLTTGCCEVLGWAYTDQVLVRWNTTELLVWQASTGSLRRVASLPGFQEVPVLGTPAVSVAIAP